MGRWRKGETVRRIWARRGWAGAEAGGEGVSEGGGKGEGGGRGGVLVGYMVCVMG